MITLHEATKRYGSHPALDRLSLRIPPGRTTALLGPSGCGKSTLVRAIAGLVSLDSGTIQLEQAPLTRENARHWRKSIGYVIQDGGLFPHLTAHDNLALVPRTLRWPRDRIEARIGELVALTHFPRAALDRFPMELSGGQKQRVSLMRALMQDPPVLLLDEPLGALDPMIRRDLQADLKSIFHKLGKTVLLVTHDLVEAAFLGHVLVLMREGRIVQQGSLDELAREPADPFVTRFINAQRIPPEDSR